MNANHNSATAPLLEVKGLRVAYGPVEALKGVDLVVPKGRIVTLLGANGAGKSSTLNALVGLAPKKAGSVLFGGREIAGLAPEQIVRMGMTLTPEGRRIFPSLSVDENLLLGGAVHRARGAIANVREDMLTRFPILKERLHQKAGSLSGGEQQMLAIARSMMSSPDLLLLDEPSLGLAPQVVDMIFELIAGLRAQGLTILLVEQNVSLSLEIADAGYVMANGKIVLSGTAAELRDSSEIQGAYLGA
ncbi:branched-chain amino acid transport system ATP-binding protein [Mesorhizobium soli]|uniref:ABC transporter ATP-binding protein n=1 Tax=Pseudaminobacter soli (ex Li et al. 2025) TaxID=1295366 RepID=UPI002475D0C5|nr:ABC transporter ATP-binding protein [Mesorhizobium soli]MDH6230527.1 branched-chain amino acid transport system ATP-binding protein [Mesorhizobium soli]